MEEGQHTLRDLVRRTKHIKNEHRMLVSSLISLKLLPGPMNLQCWWGWGGVGAAFCILVWGGGTTQKLVA